MRIRRRSPAPLYLRVNAYRAADLFLLDKKLGSKTINAAITARLNGYKKRSKRKLNTSHPSWDDHFLIPLKTGDESQVLVMTVWNRTPRTRSYLGEVRLKVLEVFEDNDGLFKTLPQWYKLYLNENEHCYVTGSVLLLFQLQTSAKNDNKGMADPSKQPTSKAGPVLLVSPPTNANLSVDSLSLSEDTLGQKFSSWTSSLVQSEPSEHSLLPNDQGFYNNLTNSVEVSGMSDMSDVESMDEEVRKVNRKSSSGPLRLIQKSQSQMLESELTKSTPGVLKVLPDSDDSRTDYLSASDALSLSSYNSDALYTSDSGLNGPGPEKVKKKRFRRKKTEDAKYELRHRNVKGVMFLEILSCSDLPPVKNFTRMGFDMDPFVVVTFGKMTFRTSWKRHTLDPVYNERLAFEVMEHEGNFNVQFSVLDKDHFLFHDKVADVSVSVQNIVDIASEPTSESQSTREPTEEDVIQDHATANPDNSPSNSSDAEPLLGSKNVNNSTVSLASVAEVPGHHAIQIAENGNLVKTRKKKKFKRRRYSVLYVDTSLFKTLNLKLNLHDQTLALKHNPTLKVRARFITYDNLRRDFWRLLLEEYILNDLNDLTTEMDSIELISFLDALGSPNSDKIVTDFYKQLDRSLWGGDVVTFDEIVEYLGSYITHEKGNPDEKIFEIDSCPVCHQKRFTKKEDLDIVTHVAICASKNWSIANKILTSSYATAQVASRRWYSKFLIKLTYGKYQLGSNSANIFVQDRSTGIIMEERMGVTVRLGIRLLYKGLDKAKSKRVRSLLRKLSIKQGIKFDSPQLARDIASFIRFHRLDLSECQIKDPSGFATFNEFFYRKLAPGARPTEAPEEEGIAVSPADCRCTTFVTVDSATEIWIKGRNFTLAKLFNGNFNNYEKTNIYDPKNCSVGIFRLAPQDYHRFHCPVTGTIGPMKYIEGEYYTVNPMAIRSDLDVYGENVRVIVPIHSEKFGTVIMVCVGAMMVGSTIITVKEGQKVKRGDEIGYFKFGGSTVLLLFDKNVLGFDSDLVDNSKTCVETLVRVGQSIGHHPDVPQHKREHIDFSKQTKGFKLNLIRAITGGDLGDLNTWESANIKLNHKNLEDFVIEEGMDNDSDLFDDLRDSNEEDLIDSE